MAQIKYLVDLNIRGNKLIDVVLGSTVGTIPGAVWYDAGTGEVKFVDDNSAVQVFASAASVTAAVQAEESDRVSEISRVDGLIDALESRMDAVEADLAALDATYATEAEVAAAVLVEENRALAAEGALDTRMDSAESELVSLDGRLDSAESDITSLDGRLDTAESDINALESADVALDGRLDTAESDIVALDGRLDTVEGQIAALDSTYATDAALASAVGTINGQLSAIVTSGTATNNTQNSRLTALEANDVAMQTSINNVEAAVAALDTTYATDAALASETSARESADSALDGRLDALEAVVTKYAANVGNGSSTAITVSHGLSSSDVIVQVREVSSGEVVACGITVVDSGSVTLNFNSAPASNSLRVVVQK